MNKVVVQGVDFFFPTLPPLFSKLLAPLLLAASLMLFDQVRHHTFAIWILDIYSQTCEPMERISVCKPFSIVEVKPIITICIAMIASI